MNSSFVFSFPISVKYQWVLSQALRLFLEASGQTNDTRMTVRTS
jgi:hypothetical protein